MKKTRYLTRQTGLELSYKKKAARLAEISAEESEFTRLARLLYDSKPLFNSISVKNRDLGKAG